MRFLGLGLFQGIVLMLLSIRITSLTLRSTCKFIHWKLDRLSRQRHSTANAFTSSIQVDGSGQLYHRLQETYLRLEKFLVQLSYKPTLSTRKSAKSRNFACLSFYHFHSTSEERVKSLKDHLRHKISELDPLIKGTLLISAREGVNGAFMIPSEKLSEFKQLLSDTDKRLFHPELLSFNIGDTITIPVAEHIQPKIELLRALTEDYQIVFSSQEDLLTIQQIQDLTPNINSFLTKQRNYNLTISPSRLNVPKNYAVAMENLSRKYHKMMRGLQGEVTEYFTHHFPFSKLVIKEKNQILTDGLLSDGDHSINRNYDWTKAGRELTPQEWHEEIINSYSGVPKEEIVDPNTYTKDTLNSLPVPKDASVPIILDCRNDFESELGTFQNAIPLNTTTFRDTFPRLEILLKEIPKNRRILTFCTGGIRCVKVNAYLEQALGFENTARLEKGIIAYEQWLKQQLIDTPPSKKSNYVERDVSHSQSNNGNGLPHEKMRQSLFIGTNFLFDRRRLNNADFS